MATFSEIATAMQGLLEEQGTPRNVREKLQGMLAGIKEPGEAKMKADRMLAALDDLQSDLNIPSYVRTGLWSISSMLENLDE